MNLPSKQKQPKCPSIDEWIKNDEIEILPFAAMWIDSDKTILSEINQISSGAQTCLTLCDPMDCSTPGLLEFKLPEFKQTHVH